MHSVRSCLRPSLVEISSYRLNFRNYRQTKPLSYSPIPPISNPPTHSAILQWTQTPIRETTAASRSTLFCSSRHFPHPTTYSEMSSTQRESGHSTGRRPTAAHALWIGSPALGIEPPGLVYLAMAMGCRLVAVIPLL